MPGVSCDRDMRGILTQAKSRAGSHISVTELGRYPPTRAARDRPTFCEVRRIMLASVWEVGRDGGEGSLVGVPKSSLLGEGLLSRFDPKDSPRGLGGCSASIGLDGSELGELWPWGLKGDCWAMRRKMWMVSVALDTARRDDVELNDMQYIWAGKDPRRKWNNRSPDGTLKTRMMVPFSDAVASIVPELFIAIQPRVD